MIDVRVYFWAGTADERVMNFMLDDNSTVFDMKNTLVDPQIGSPFQNHGTTQFAVVDHANPAIPLPDGQALVDDGEYEAIME